MKIKVLLSEKLRESVFSVLPVSAAVLLLSLSVAPLPNSVFISFLFGAFFMVLGIGLFNIGVDRSMTPMGEYVGKEMTRSRKLLLICFITLVVGALITVSEPDLMVLAGYVPSIDTTVFILSVAAGVGVFLVVAILRIIFAVKLRYLLLFCYGAVFVLAFFVSPDFWSVAFDAGGVTTGPLSVPFIMAMGVGISAISSDREGSGDSFGLMALCSVGPIISILVLGLLYDVGGASYAPSELPAFSTSGEFGRSLLYGLPHRLLEVAKGLFPIVIFFFIYQAFAAPVGKGAFIKFLVGAMYTYVGIVLFLTGVNVGFLPVGSYLGSFLGGSSMRFVLVPLGMLFGYFIVSAEPAVRVLEKQVEEVTSGAIPKRMLSAAMSVGVSLAVGLSMVRVLTGIPILWFVGIGYALALLLSFFVPEVFTSIAFDSGGVASGAMSSAFLMPLAVGASAAMGGNIMKDAFGVIAMVALLPPITIQILGLIYKIKTKGMPIEDDADGVKGIIEMAHISQQAKKPIAVRTRAVSRKRTEKAKEYPDIIEFEREGRW